MTRERMADLASSPPVCDGFPTRTNRNEYALWESVSRLTADDNFAVSFVELAMCTLVYQYTFAIQAV